MMENCLLTKSVLSLVQTSQNRREELKRFLNSLNAQEMIDFKGIQLIFVDQGDNLDIFKEINPLIDFKYIKATPCSLSKARNIGLEYVKGEFVGFPDDDCWYEEDTLYKVLCYLSQGKYQGVTGKGTNENGELTSKFLTHASVLTTAHSYSAISYTLFFVFKRGLFFDENIGVGSPYNIGSGEETDYLLNLMEKYNYKVYYDPSIIVHHPTNAIYDWSVVKKKTYSYARGGGYLMQKHSFPLSYMLLQFLRPCVGMVVNLLKMDTKASVRSYNNLKGRIEGYLWKGQRT